ncbi:MAG: ATP-binding cassette domain-containing protein, partial [Oscillospiraceae bacterium]
MNNIISSENLELYYGNFKALKGISMDIAEKEITAFIGPSGCGKSTFLKTLNRMNDLVEGVKIDGCVKFHDKNIYAPDIDVTHLRRQIGMVFQKPNPFPMSIYDNVAYGPRLHESLTRAQMNELVEKSLRGAALWDEV